MSISSLFPSRPLNIIGLLLLAVLAIAITINIKLPGSSVTTPPDINIDVDIHENASELVAPPATTAKPVPVSIPRSATAIGSPISTTSTTPRSSTN